MITGTTYIRDAIRFDFCIEEAILSIAPLCDRIICLECSSNDDTLDLLNELKLQIPQLEIIEGVEWEIGEKHHRLRLLSDMTRKMIKNNSWRIHIQADEVLHESSYLPIKSFVLNECVSNYYDSVFARRINIFGDHDHYIDPKMPNAPCSSRIIRIANSHIKSAGDDESLAGKATCNANKNDIVFFHYSYIRKMDELIEKSIDMQTWFHGDRNAVDERLIIARGKGRYDPADFIHPDHLLKIDLPHPKVAEKWVNDRRQHYEKITNE